jgi:hypothetical protein
MRPPHILENHWHEWTVESGIDPELASLNLESIGGQIPYERLLNNWDSGKVQPDAVNREINKRFGDNWSDGGWWCSGINVLTGKDSPWGCFKSNRPRIDKSKGFDPQKPKPIKYEHPVKTSTEIFALKVPRHLWEKLSQRWGVPIGEYTSFWQWVIDHPFIPIILTEGAKKAGALLTAGYVAIALPGIWSGVRQPKDEFGNRVGRAFLIPQLIPFAQKERQIYLAFDQDASSKSLRNCNKAVAATASLFTKEGCKVKIVIWGKELGKGVDDLLVNHGEDVFEERFVAALSSEVWGVRQLKTLTYKPDLELDQHYLTDEKDGEYTACFQPPSDAQLVCINSPKNSAKTEALADLIKPYLLQGKRILVLTHRIQLGEALCQRFGINYVTEIKDSQTGQLLGYGLCVDSLHGKSQAKFNPKDWEEACIIIDECQQVFWHLLNSTTCQSDRVEILRCLKEVIQIALATGGRVFLSDADLSDVSIDYIRGLAGFDLKPWLLVNKWKPEKGWDITVYPNRGKHGGSPKTLMADLITYIEQGGKPFICVSGQKKKSKWGTQILETFLQSQFPDKKILRIDRESIADPQHPAFGCIAHLDEVLPLYDIVLASPTIETGVSIDCHHFTSVWGMFQGVQTTDSVRQALARVRDSVPRYIWVKKYGLSRVGNGSTSIKSLLASQHKMVKANINLLNQAGFTDDFGSDFQNESLICWAKLAALVNLGMSNYSDSIIEALTAEGHTVHSVASIDPDAANHARDGIIDTQEFEYAAHNEAVTQAESIPDEVEFRKLKDKRAKTETERLQVQKGELERLYNVPVTPELAEKHDNGWHPQIRLHYFLSVGREYLADRDVKQVVKQLEKGNGDNSIYLPDFNRSQLGLKVWLLEKSGFLKLLERSEIRADDAELSTVADFCKQHFFEIRAVLGVSARPNESPMAICQKLAKTIGYQFPFLRKEGGRGEQVAVYGAAAADFVRDDKGEIVRVDGEVTPLLDGRENVFAAWLERDRAAVQSQAETVAREIEENVSSSVLGSRAFPYIDLRGDLNTTTTTTTEGVACGLVEGIAQDLSICDCPEMLAAVVGAYSVLDEYVPEMVQDAITLQDSAPLRNQMRTWLEALNSPPDPSVDELSEPDKPQIKQGSQVKVRSSGVGRCGWVDGLAGVVESVAGLGRCLIRFVDGRSEIFDDSDLSPLSSG